MAPSSNATAVDGRAESPVFSPGCVSPTPDRAAAPRRATLVRRPHLAQHNRVVRDPRPGLPVDFRTAAFDRFTAAAMEMVVGARGT